MISVVRLDGEHILPALALRELTTIGSLQRRVARHLMCGSVQLVSGTTTFSVPTISAGAVLSDGDLIYAIIDCQLGHASAAHGAFAFIKADDGSVVTWGEPLYGGNSVMVKEALACGVQRIYSTTAAFAALKADGSVVTWGSASVGGDSEDVEEDLKEEERI